MSRFAGEVCSVFCRLTWTVATAVTFTTGVVKVPGAVSRLMPSAVFAATVPSGVVPFGKRTLISRSPLLPAGSGSIMSKRTRVRPLPMKLGVTWMAKTSPVGLAGTVERYATSAGSRSITSAPRHGPDVLLQLYVSRYANVAPVCFVLPGSTWIADLSSGCAASGRTNEQRTNRAPAMRRITSSPRVKRMSGGDRGGKPTGTVIWKACKKERRSVREASK